MSSRSLGSSSSSSSSPPVRSPGGSERLAPAEVRLALVHGLPQGSIDQAITTHQLIHWDSSVDASEELVVKNHTVLEALLKLCPHRVPTTAELQQGFQELDRTCSFALSGQQKKKSQRNWSQGEAEKVRALLAHIREITRKSKSARSRQPTIQRLKSLVVHKLKETGAADSTTAGGQHKWRSQLVKHLWHRKRKRLVVQPPSPSKLPKLQSATPAPETQPWTEPEDDCSETETHISVSESEDEAATATPAVLRGPEAMVVSAAVQPPAVVPAKVAHEPAPETAASVLVASAPPAGASSDAKHHPPALVAPAADVSERSGEVPLIEGKPLNALLRTKLQAPASWQWAAKVAKENQGTVLEAQTQHTLRREKRKEVAVTRSGKSKAEPTAKIGKRKAAVDAADLVATERLGALDKRQAVACPPNPVEAEESTATAAKTSTAVGSSHTHEGHSPVVPLAMLKHTELINKLPEAAWPPTTSAGAHNYMVRQEGSAIAICVRLGISELLSA